MLYHHNHHHHQNDGANEPGWRRVDCVDQFTPLPLLLQLLQLRECIINCLPQLGEILGSSNGKPTASKTEEFSEKFQKIILQTSLLGRRAASETRKLIVAK